MNIYIICAVRNATPERIAQLRAYAEVKMNEGHTVHFPPDDAPQDDETGVNICLVHREAMIDCDEVHVFWDVTSSGSHFDLGMAFMAQALLAGKRIVPVECEQPDPPGKSYWKVMKCLNG